ncbi:hypothetical protein OG905_23245 [Streptomyces sp. NBC_00322]|uniref:hypothetical protein n=1 Tax=Streptomyces sp. NBC_00322 TaxID=2975712 RepID=UPI002E2DB2A8|nr:hypothetical protein [Streptomyces sp. NBC_00322]
MPPQFRDSYAFDNRMAAYNVADPAEIPRISERLRGASGWNKQNHDLWVSGSGFTPGRIAGVYAYEYRAKKWHQRNEFEVARQWVNSEGKMHLPDISYDVCTVDQPGKYMVILLVDWATGALISADAQQVPCGWEGR